MDIPQVLEEKSTAFENRPVTVRYEGDTTILTLHKETNSFQEMLAERNNSKNVEDLEQRLMGEGAVLANVGVSAFPVVELKYPEENERERYILATKADRTKLISGYVPAKFMHAPESHLIQEIAEEFLPTRNEKVLTGKVGDYGNSVGLDKPYEDKIPYEEDSSFMFKNWNDVSLPGMRKGKIIIRDGEEEYRLPKYAQFHVAADTNSGQLIFKYTTQLIHGGDLSFHHSEDELNTDKNTLDTHFHPEGIILLELKDPYGTEHGLTGKAFTLSDGELKPYNNPVNLTEAFAPKRNGISDRGSIGLTEYLSTQK